MLNRRRTQSPFSDSCACSVASSATRIFQMSKETWKSNVNVIMITATTWKKKQKKTNGVPELVFYWESSAKKARTWKGSLLGNISPSFERKVVPTKKQCIYVTWWCSYQHNSTNKATVPQSKGNVYAIVNVLYQRISQRTKPDIVWLLSLRMSSLMVEM